MIQATLINLHPNEYGQEFHYYPFSVKLDVLQVVILLMIQGTLINLHPNDYGQEFHCYPFSVKLDVPQVVILLMTCLIKHVFQVKQKI